MGSAFLVAAAFLAVLVAATILRVPDTSGPASPTASQPGTAESSPSASASPMADATPKVDPDLAYSCSVGDPFSPSLFDEPPVDLQSLPAGVALARFLASGNDEEHTLPRRGDWHLAAQRDDRVSFVAVVPADPPYVSVRVELEDGEWGVTGWGQCRPILAVEGVNGASWRVARGQTIDASTTSFVATVTEHECTGGTSSEGRVREPLITYDAERVVIIFTVDPLPAGMFTCPSNPATKVRVELSEPLGDRQLLDGGEYPWADATEPDPLAG